MKWIIATMVMLFAVSMVAQQQNQSGSQTMPPSMSYLSTASNSTIWHDIQSTLDTRGEFDPNHMGVRVTNDYVVLSGYALLPSQKDAALNVVSEYAGNREIIDDVIVGSLGFDGGN